MCSLYIYVSTQLSIILCHFLSTLNIELCYWLPIILIVLVTVIPNNFKHSIYLLWSSSIVGVLFSSYYYLEVQTYICSLGLLLPLSCGFHLPTLCSVLSSSSYLGYETPGLSVQPAPVWYFAYLWAGLGLLPHAGCAAGGPLPCHPYPPSGRVGPTWGW